MHCRLAAGSVPAIRRAAGARVALVLGVVVAFGCLPAAARTDAVGLRYDVALAPTGDARIDRTVERVSMLVALRDDETLPAFSLIARADADRLRIDDVLRSFGYYDAVVDVQIDDIALSDPTQLQVLAARAGEGAVSVAVRIDAGPLYRLGAVGTDGHIPPAAAAAFDLRSGEPAQARRVLAAGAAVRDALREDGFALARVPPPQVTVDHRTRTMDVHYAVEPGPRVSIGAIEVAGLERLREDFARRRLGLTPGDAYSPSRLEQARRDLLASDAVAAARITPASATDADGRLPLRIDVVERARRTIRFGGAFASDEGVSLSAGWEHRNLFGSAERLSADLEIGDIDGASARRFDYSAGLSLRLPDRRRRDLDIAFDVVAVSESLDAYDRDAITFGAALEQRISSRLSAALGVAFERSRIVEEGPAEDFRLFSLPLMLAWDGTDQPLDPRQGLRFDARVVPVPLVQGDRPSFVRADLSAVGYLDLGRRSPAGKVFDEGDGDETRPPGPTVLAGRLALGRIVGAGADAVPADWRFYAGGAGSVRGYPYQSIGPRTAGDSPAGGDAAVEASLELRRRIAGPWGIVAFADGGAVARDGLQELGAFKIGVGLGVRFHTVIGPLRADLAAPLEPSPGDAPVQIYLGIGQAF
jgi:translocation and assembly module TamA